MRSHRGSGRNPRATRACARCRKRKIKCDFVYPRCGTCITVGVDCLGYDATTGEEQPRSLVTFLENKIAHLEIELSSLQGRATRDQNAGQGESTLHAFSEIKSQLLQTLTLRNGQDCADGTTTSWKSIPYISSSLLPTLALAEAPAIVDTSGMNDRTPVQKRDIASIPRNVVDIMLRHYSEFYLAQYPIIDEMELMEQCNRVYERTATPFDLFVVCMALSISAHTLIRHDQERATKAADEFWETAIINLHSVLQQSILIQIQSIMLLCHYSFANPMIVNTGMCSRAAMALCVQLGLHQEPPAENIRSHIDLESQRRIFWTCYVLDAQANMLTGKLSSLVDVNISVRFPTIKKNDSKMSEKMEIANYWYAFRQLEAEITLGMLHPDKCKDSRITSAEWLDDARTRIDYWRESLDSHQWAIRVEFRYIAYNFQRIRLNRISPRVPNPTNAMRRECIAAGIFIASEYVRHSRQGSFFYWNHCCCQMFEIGIVFVEATHTGIDLMLQQQETFLDPTNMNDIARLMRSIPVALNRMIHRWPRVKQMTLELEGLFKPALHRLDKFISGKGMDIDYSNVGLVSYQISSIRKYLLDSSREANAENPEEENTTSYSQFDSQVTAAQNLLSMTKSTTGEGSSMTMEEVLHVLQPDSEMNDDNVWSQPASDINHPAIIDPISGTESASVLYDARPSALITTMDENSSCAHLDVETRWLSPSGNSLFWHGNGIDLDDIFTAFNEGNIY